MARAYFLPLLGLEGAGEGGRAWPSISSRWATLVNALGPAAAEEEEEVEEEEEDDMFVVYGLVTRGQRPEGELFKGGSCLSI